VKTRGMETATFRLVERWLILHNRTQFHGPTFKSV